MPPKNEQQSSPWLVVLVCAGLFFWWQSAQNPTPVPPSPDDENEVDPQPVVDPAESEYWSALAVLVERTSFGVHQQHTDHLLQIVDILKSADAIKDDSRVADWRAKRIDITDANRAEISRQLRGQ
jgi:hypothetical protein